MNRDRKGERERDFTDLLSGGEVEELRAIVGESGEFK